MSILTMPLTEVRRGGILVMLAPVAATAFAGFTVANGDWWGLTLVVLGSAAFIAATRLGAQAAAVVVLTLALPLYGVPWVASFAPSFGLLTVLLLAVAATVALAHERVSTDAVRNRSLWLLVAFGAAVLWSLVAAPRGDATLGLAKTYEARAVLMPTLIVLALGTVPLAARVRLLLALRMLLIAVGAVGGLLSLVQVGAETGYVVPAGAASLGVSQFVGARAIGFSESPGTWAAFLLLPLGLALTKLLRRGGALDAAALGAIALGLVLSGTRSAWLASGAMTILALGFARGPRRARLAAPAALVAAAVLALGLNNFRSFLSGSNPGMLAVYAPTELASARPAPLVAGPKTPRAASVQVGEGRLGQDESVKQRYLLTRSELELGARHPLAGVGLGNIGPALGRLKPSYLLPKNGTQLIVPGEPIEKHDVYSGLFAELGIPGIGMFLVVLAATFSSLIRSGRRIRDPELRAFVHGLLAALLGTVIVGVFWDVDRQAFLWWIVGIAFALAAYVRRTEAARGSVEP